MTLSYIIVSYVSRNTQDDILRNRINYILFTVFSFFYILQHMAKTVDDKKIIYTMDRVSRAYGTKVVLKDVSISYYYGAKIGVLGENGAGKSSLFKIFV